MPGSPMPQTPVGAAVDSFTDWVKSNVMLIAVLGIGGYILFSKVVK